MIEIYKGDKGNIDFRVPLKLNDEQKERFFNFFNEFFSFVKEEKVDEMRTERIGSKNFIRSWDAEELELLFCIDKSNEVLSKKLGRSWMSIEMKRLEIVPKIQEYAREKKVDLYNVDIKKLVKDYLNENEMKIIERKRKKELEKKKMLQTKKELEEIELLERDIPKHKKMIGANIPGFTSGGLKEKNERLRELKEKNV